MAAYESITWILLVSSVLLQIVSKSTSYTPLEYDSDGGESMLSLLGEEENPEKSCKISKALLAEIQSYRPTVEKIGELILNGSWKGIAYKNLSDFVDMYGARLVGSEALEKAIDYVLEAMQSSGLDNVHSEDVIAPKWIRGHESLHLIQPYKKNIQVLGLHPTVQTPEEGITSEIVVVGSYRDLHENKNNVLSKVKGKILVYNHPFDDPASAILYRFRGAVEGAKVGAIATLTRSYTTFSLSTPHVGEVHYEEEVAPIPHAEITIEDAELLSRLYEKGVKTVLHLTLRNQHLGNTTTRNSVGDLTGSTIPNEFMLMSAHVDSWDIGQGVLDGGYGVVLSLLVPNVLKSLNLSPKRTLRTIIWTAEEVGKVPLGAQQYVERHQDELQNYTMFLEADSGIFNVKGLFFNGSEEARCITSHILKLLEPKIIEKTGIMGFPEIKTDIVQLMRASQVPGAIFLTDFVQYFWYHHSNADTVTALNPKDLDVCLALMTSLSYVLADLSILLPR